MAIDEQRIDEIFNEINSEEEIKKQSSEEIDVDDFVSELEKNASEINAFIKEANEKDVEKINEEGVKGKILVESDNESKQRLKEIALKGIKVNKSDESYAKLRKKLLGQHEDLVEDLSEKVANMILDGEI